MSKRYWTGFCLFMFGFVMWIEFGGVDIVSKVLGMVAVVAWYVWMFSEDKP